jgi:hypothetical protein
MTFCNRVVAAKVLLLVQVMVLRNILKNRVREGGISLRGEINRAVETIMMIL